MKKQLILLKPPTPGISSIEEIIYQQANRQMQEVRFFHSSRSVKQGAQVTP